jgi:lysophospholipase L1-like esterase
MKPGFNGVYAYPGHDYAMPVRLNAYGFRDDEWDEARFEDPHVHTVLLLGDSFVFGYGVDVEDTFAHRLEALLDEQAAQFEVANAGVGGWGTLQAVTFARDHFAFFHPDIVVLTFCGNDPADDARFRMGIHDSAEGVLRFPGKQVLRRHSHLYRLVRCRFAAYIHQAAARRKLREADGDADRIAMRASVIADEDWERTRRTVREFHGDLLNFNSNAVLIVQACSPWDGSVRAELGRLDNGRNLFYLDLFEATAAVREEERVMPHDGHWSPFIHRLVAQHLFEVITPLAEQQTVRKAPSIKRESMAVLARNLTD